jgi:hypothetical protein
MKKHLLMGTVLFAATIAVSQNSRVTPQRAGVINVDEEKNLRLQLTHSEPKALAPTSIPNLVSTLSKQSSPPSTISWNLLCGSMNCYGMLTSQQRPLQYNPALNAVSFIHRKSTSYQPSPSVPSTAEPGVIVAEISSNWGTTWDSTCIWSNINDWGRYPQGAIYNPANNTSISNAYIVGSGPTVGTNSFSGDWYASKKLNAFDNIASTATGAQQFFSFNLATYPPDMCKHAWSRTGFSSTNDGIVRSLAVVGTNLQGTSDMRGFAVVTGTFNGTAFDWHTDTIIPPLFLKPDGNKYVNGDGQMAWNPAGTIGYIVGIGVLANATLSCKSYQPFIYKMDRTVNANATWTMQPPIDLNDPQYKRVLDGMPRQPKTQPTTNGDSLSIPFTYDFDITVDANNDLHIGIVFCSGSSDHPDSLNYYANWKTSINPTESYRWGHINGWRPYIYDFVGNGSQAWKMHVVDSMSSEAPGELSSYPGYNDNPWDNTGPNGQKISMDSRLQLGRTPDGQFVTFSWAESDSSYTFNAYKWNSLPDLQTRLMAIGSGTNAYKMDVGPRQNITQSDNNVRTRATLHYMSPTTGSATIYPGALGAYTVDINTPFTVTNSNPYSQLTNNSTWYGAGRLSYKFPSTSTGVGLKENGGQLSICEIYPNPAQHRAVLSAYFPEQGAIEISFMNMIGQNVKTIKQSVQAGQNNIWLDLNGVTSGVYIIGIKQGGTTTTKKLIVE